MCGNVSKMSNERVRLGNGVQILGLTKCELILLGPHDDSRSPSTSRLSSEDRACSGRVQFGEDSSRALTDRTDRGSACLVETFEGSDEEIDADSGDAEVVGVQDWLEELSGPAVLYASILGALTGEEAWKAESLWLADAFWPPWPKWIRDECGISSCQWLAGDAYSARAR